MLARCLNIDPNRHPIKIKAKDYIDLLELGYDSFANATHIWGEIRGHPFSYDYVVAEENDSEATRLSYIDYLVNQKGFNI